MRDPGLHILQHALGLDDYGQGSWYRNRYVATEGSADYERCMAHVEAGRMTRHGPSNLFGSLTSYCFVVTEAGKAYVREHSPRPPRLTRSQRRYRDYPGCGLMHAEESCRVPVLRSLFAGPLSEREERCLRWLATWDEDTLSTLAGLMQRTRR